MATVKKKAVKRTASGKYKKGTSGGPGKPRGSKNKKTQQWEALGKYLTEEGADRYLQILMATDDKKFMTHYHALLEYFKPRLNRTALTDGDGDSIKFEVVVRDKPEH